MKRLLTIAFLACAALTASADDEPFVLRNGNATMTVDPAKGGKILSLKYKDTEVLSQSRWPESFGSTFWTSPQSEWNWPPVPEYDSRPYTAEQKNGALILTGEESARYHYRIRKEFRPAGNCIEVTYSIINEAAVERKVAPWEISRVPSDGVIFFDATPETITPIGLLPITFQNEGSWYQVDEARANRKINADGAGWYAYANDGLLLVKRFEDIDPTQPAPKESEVQVYVNAGKTFIELEAQGAYTSLKPGEALSWTVRWYLLPQDCGSEPSQALMDLVKSVIK